MILFSRKAAQGWRRILNRSRRDHKRERSQRTSPVKLSVRGELLQTTRPRRAACGRTRWCWVAETPAEPLGRESRWRNRGWKARAGWGNKAECTGRVIPSESKECDHNCQSEGNTLIFAWIRARHDMRSLQFGLQMLFISSKICVSKYFKKIYRRGVLMFSSMLKKKACTLVQKAFAHISESCIHFTAFKLAFVAWTHHSARGHADSPQQHGHGCCRWGLCPLMNFSMPFFSSFHRVMEWFRLEKPPKIIRSNI